jgi:L-lactate utilization protein LutB
MEVGLMNGMSFEAALNSRVDQMLDACVKCGKCVDVCPGVQPAGIASMSPQDVIAGVLEIVRTGDGPDASRRWATSCMLSGDCIASHCTNTPASPASWTPPPTSCGRFPA